MECIDHGQRGSARMGYGSVNWAGKPEKAHRAAYMREHSCSLLPRVVVRHSCDNPRCINPAHLELGTVADNNRDRDERGRAALGMRHGKAKLTDDEVIAIRERYALGGESHRSLAAEYGVSHKVIGKLIRRITWKHL